MALGLLPSPAEGTNYNRAQDKSIFIGVTVSPGGETKQVSDNAGKTHYNFSVIALEGMFQ